MIWLASFQICGDLFDGPRYVPCSIRGLCAFEMNVSFTLVGESVRRIINLVKTGDKEKIFKAAQEFPFCAEQQG